MLRRAAVPATGTPGQIPRAIQVAAVSPARCRVAGEIWRRFTFPSVCLTTRGRQALLRRWLRHFVPWTILILCSTHRAAEIRSALIRRSDKLNHFCIGDAMLRTDGSGGHDLRTLSRG